MCKSNNSVLSHAYCALKTLHTYSIHCLNFDLPLTEFPRLSFRQLNLTLLAFFVCTKMLPNSEGLLYSVHSVTNYSYRTVRLRINFRFERIKHLGLRNVSLRFYVPKRPSSDTIDRSLIISVLLSLIHQISRKD